MIIDFQNLNTDRNASLPYTRKVYDRYNNHSIEIKNFVAGKKLDSMEFRNLIAVYCYGNSIKLTNVDFSRCETPSELFRRLSIDELRLDNVKFCDGANFKGYFNNAKILKHNLCDFSINGAKNISHMFEGANIKNLKVNHWDTSSLVEASWCFSDNKMDTLNLSGWDTSNLRDADAMFESCEIDTLILDWNNAPNLSNITKMFAYSKIGYLSLRGMNLDTSSISSVFMGCNIKVLDLRGATLPNSDRLMNMYWFNGSKIEYILYNRPDEFNQNILTFASKKPIVVGNVDSIPYHSQYNIRR